MAISIRVYPELSPRIIEILSPTTTASLQEVVDAVRTWEDSWAGITHPKLIDASGKEDLGGSVSVGITAQLQNAQIAFQQRGGSDSSGTVTTGSTNGTTLEDTGADFVSDGIVPGDSIYNITDGSMTTILAVTTTTLTTFALEGGSDNQWDISDNYRVWNKVQCEVNGGNLVAVDENGNTISSFLPTAETHVTRTSSSSATLQEQEDLQYSAFQNAVWIDTVNGIDSLTFPAGTPRAPVKTLAGALAINALSSRGFDRLGVIGDFTFGASDVLDNLVIFGQHPSKSKLTLVSGVSTVKTEFENATITGDVSDAIFVRDCHLEDLDNFGSTLYDTAFHSCVFENSVVYTVNSSTTKPIYVINCDSGKAGHGYIKFDVNGAGCEFVFSKWSGDLELRGVSHANAMVTVNTDSGHIVAASSCTAGLIVLHGTGISEDNTGVGCTFDTSGLVNPSTISNNVWDELTSTHATSGTFGALIKRLMKVGDYIALNK